MKHKIIIWSIILFKCFDYAILLAIMIYPYAIGNRTIYIAIAFTFNVLTLIIAIFYWFSNNKKPKGKAIQKGNSTNVNNFS